MSGLKTFKLKKLIVIEGVNDKQKRHKINLIDGLIINREDEQNRWVIEAYTTADYIDFFKRFEGREPIQLQVKITKETNPPALFTTKMIGMNLMDDKMNVLFIGTIIDERMSNIENTLQRLIKEGYEGEDLLQQFKNSL
ncbi:MAG TPA: YwpF family protein [Cerasibacillus sp.]|uniref:YwpF family protein n=1 Tax=Cerasibacillus sp. TaxID=2498711 RepID=UPI002F3E2918